MYVDITLTGLHKTLHVFDVDVESSCEDAFMIYGGEDGNVPYDTTKGERKAFSEYRSRKGENVLRIRRIVRKILSFIFVYLSVT